MNNNWRDTLFLAKVRQGELMAAAQTDRQLHEAGVRDSRRRLLETCVLVLIAILLGLIAIWML